MMANPDLMRQMMENPFVQQLMSNPDVMRQMITSNPQMRELMEVIRSQFCAIVTRTSKVEFFLLKC